jgi:peptidoglycan/xylan/chitin deacetylase (PgdA/CDA1 family)
MRVLFFKQKQVQRGLIFLLLMIFTAGVVANWDRFARRIFGVKQGVRLEGRVVQGFLPDEVTSLVKTLAAQVNREPRNASYIPETGEILPAESGKLVDVARTVHQVCMAPAGSVARLVVNPVPPPITEDLFKPVYQGDKTASRVALAINVAWGEEHLGEMLKILAEEKTKATFFFVGTWVKLFPELVRNIAAAGHEVANHGLFHGHPAQMSREQVKKLISDNALLLWSITGKQPANLFAPPYGEISPEVLAAAGELGNYTILWSVDTVDWKNPDPQEMLRRVLGKIEPGGILLMHPTVATKTVFRELIRSLRQRNLEPGTVSQVMGKS